MEEPQTKSALFLGVQGRRSGLVESTVDRVTEKKHNAERLDHCEILLAKKWSPGRLGRKMGLISTVFSICPSKASILSFEKHQLRLNPRIENEAEVRVVIWKRLLWHITHTEEIFGNLNCERPGTIEEACCFLVDLMIDAENCRMKSFLVDVCGGYKSSWNDSVWK